MWLIIWLDSNFCPDTPLTINDWTTLKDANKINFSPKLAADIEQETTFPRKQEDEINNYWPIQTEKAHCHIWIFH